MNITVIGHVCIDNNVSENASYKSAGGPAVFISRVASFFPDAETSIITPYGEDFKEYSAPYRLIPSQATEEKTLTYYNHTHDGHREQKALNRDYSNPLVINETMAEKIKLSDIVFIAPLTPGFSVEYVKQIRSLASENAVIALLPQGYYRNFDGDNNVVPREFTEADELIWLVDIIVVSEQDHTEMAETASSWSKKSDVIVVVTTGDKGAVSFQKGKDMILSTQPVKDSEIVDSVGAGDIFTTGFVYEYFGSRDIRKAGDFANMLARQSLYYTTENLKFVI